MHIYNELSIVLSLYNLCVCALAENKCFQNQKRHTQFGCVWSVALFHNNLFYRLLALKIFVERVFRRKESDGMISRSIISIIFLALVIDDIINKNKDSAAGVWHTSQIFAFLCSALYFWRSICHFICQNLELKSKRKLSLCAWAVQD